MGHDVSDAEALMRARANMSSLFRKERLTAYSDYNCTGYKFAILVIKPLRLMSSMLQKNLRSVSMSAGCVATFANDAAGTVSGTAGGRMGRRQVAGDARHELDEHDGGAARECRSRMDRHHYTRQLQVHMSSAFIIG